MALDFAQVLMLGAGAATFTQQLWSGVVLNLIWYVSYSFPNQTAPNKKNLIDQPEPKFPAVLGIRSNVSSVYVRGSRIPAHCFALERVS